MNRARPRNAGRFLILCFFLLCSLLILPAAAAGFGMAGARSMGMGGAFVAACDDATAVYWNPAAITQIKGVDIQAFAGGKATDRFSDVIHDLEEWEDDHEAPYSLSEMEDLRDLLKRFNKDETGVFADAAAGLAIATKWVALSSVALAPANLTPYADTQLSHLGPTEADRADNTSRVEINSLIHNNIALTLASTLGIPNLALGANVKYIQAYRYTDCYSVFDRHTGEFQEDIDYKKRFNDNRVDGWAWGIDAGALVVLGDMLKLGVLGRNLNEPKIDWEKHQPDTKLRSQYRAGAALTLFKSLTLSADADITKQGREVIKSRSGRRFEFDESREVSAGLEWWLLGRHLALRGGVNNITESGSTDRFYTAGLGIRIPFVGLDLAGGYAGKDRYAASLALNVRF
ncbi:MAG: conjugal transfer protein TraF [candidate division NC10 bacterium]|nr:conjugal transfer protein TraF [candidate division NC10 bacterium]